MPNDDPESGSPSFEFVSQLTAHQPDLWAFILSLMPGHPDVADVLQKTNLVLWRKRTKFEAGTNFRAWAMTVARFEVMAHLKSQRRGPCFVFDEEVLEKIAAEGANGLPSSPGRLEALERCLLKLRREERDLIEHRYRRQGKLDEFAERCGRSVSALSVTLFRLRAALRRCISAELEMEGGAM